MGVHNLRKYFLPFGTSKASTFQRYYSLRSLNTSNTNELFPECKRIKEESQPEPSQSSAEAQKYHPPGTKEFKCETCNEILYLTGIEALRHKKKCVKVEKSAD